MACDREYWKEPRWPPLTQSQLSGTWDKSLSGLLSWIHHDSHALMLFLGQRGEGSACLPLTSCPTSTTSHASPVSSRGTSDWSPVGFFLATGGCPGSRPHMLRNYHSRKISRSVTDWQELVNKCPSSLSPQTLWLRGPWSALFLEFPIRVKPQLLTVVMDLLNVPLACSSALPPHLPFSCSPMNASWECLL